MNLSIRHARSRTCRQSGGWLFALTLLLAGPVTALAQAPAAPPQGTDMFVYAGWKVFHQNCYGCHGTDAVGSDIAPNLVERVSSLTAEQFATKVLTRYRIVIGASEAGADDRTALREALMREVREHKRGEAGELIMPAWESRNPNIKPHILDIYDYLQARANGSLGPGEPSINSDGP
jgi:hypothetical protein